MRHIIDSFTTHVNATENTPARDIRVLITDIVLDYKDKAVLKHLINSDVDIHKLPDIAAAYELAEKLSAENKLVTSQKNVNIRYQKWSLSKKSESESASKPCEEPSIGPDKIYNAKIVQEIILRVVGWCKERKFQSFLPFQILEECVAKTIYGDTEQNYDEQQLAMIRFAKNKFADRFCVVSPFNDKGYNLGSELMQVMHPEGVKYRIEKYARKNSRIEYFVIKDNIITDTRTGNRTFIPESTLGERNPVRLKIDQTLYYSMAA